MSGSIDMQCWKCGKELKNLLLPFSRYEECINCNADLHACIACKNFSLSVSNGCNEERADLIVEKEKSNFCEYFSANTAAYQKQNNTEATAARAKLAELFGEQPPETDICSEAASVHSEGDEALAELKRLFGDED
ncbi:MAG: hypothetical protein CNF02_01805 [OM182 bacterium MED-G28]|uniref:Uncharacterized protein n=1 Tax=OM182 bacterium MED-G28 TaxID=1986256 RepID=A0A2A5WH54_9GAMM|nr:MAG: hypothetical protein CNF02_01805 [OM182 bacterium MED-G28]